MEILAEMWVKQGCSVSSSNPAVIDDLRGDGQGIWSEEHAMARGPDASSTPTWPPKAFLLSSLWYTLPTSGSSCCVYQDMGESAELCI